MKRLRTSSDIRELGTILGVWAHPDDETFTSAGIMAAAVRNGQRVICVTATKGEAGVQDKSRWPANKLGNIRQQELEDALNILGVQNHHWLDFRDGCCEERGHEGMLCICKFIEDHQPDTILTFGHDGMTGHPDHTAVCMWAVEAKRKTGHRVKVYHAINTIEQYQKHLGKIDEKLNIFFNVNEPNLIREEDCDICFGLTPDLKDLKYKALKVMPSQTAKMLELFDKETICGALSPEAFIRSEP